MTPNSFDLFIWGGEEGSKAQKFAFWFKGGESFLHFLAAGRVDAA
jgi:hypothetical protein